MDSRKRKREEKEPAAEMSTPVQGKRSKSASRTPAPRGVAGSSRQSLDVASGSQETPQRKASEKRRSGAAEKKGKTPAGKGAKRAENAVGTPTPGRSKSKMWCEDCSDEAGAGCRAHACVDLRTARQNAAAALQTAMATLRRLDELDADGAARFQCTASLQGDECETDEGVIEVTLAGNSWSSDEKAALRTFLESLELEPDEEYLSASSAGCEAVAARCLKLPDRVDGVCLKPGAILLLGKRDGPDDVDEEEANSSWMQSSPALRIYYDNAVKPDQAREAKVLGYITSNLRLVASAKPKGRYYLSGWGERYDSGMNVTLSDVKFL